MKEKLICHLSGDHRERKDIAMNTKMTTSKFGLFVNVLLLLGLVFSSGLSISPARASNQQGEIILEYEVENPLSSDVSAAILNILAYWPKEFPDKNTFYVIDVRNEKNWGIATLTTDTTLHQFGDESLPDISKSFPVIFLRKGGEVDAAASFSPNINDLLEKFPESILPSEAKQALFDVDGSLFKANPKSNVRLQSYNDYKFPWTGGVRFRLNTTRGWHDDDFSNGVKNSLDFLPYDLTKLEVFSAAPGVVTHVKRCKYQGYVRVRTNSEYLFYLHLVSIPSNIAVGKLVYEGQLLGKVVKSTSANPVKDDCGESYGTHLHFGLPSKNFTINKYTFTSNLSSFTNLALKSKNTNPSIAIPAEFNASDGTYPDKVEVIWSGVTGATSYELWRSTTSTLAKSTKIISGANTYYHDYLTQANVVYYYWVRACNSNGCSKYKFYNSGYRNPSVSSCSPTADQIALFDQPNYLGACKVLGVGEYANATAMGFTNDTASSIKVGANVQAVLFEHNEFTGISESFIAEDPNLGNNAIGDNITSSVKISPSQLTWYQNPNNAVSDNTNLTVFHYGMKGDTPIVGDWDGDGIDTVGVFRLPNKWLLNPYNASTSENNLTTLFFGLLGDIPVVGDWDGDGTDTVGVFRPSDGTWGLSTGAGTFWYGFRFGMNGDIPVAGDWDGDGIDTVGVFRSPNLWILNRYNASTSEADWIMFYYGTTGDIPVVGDWNGDGIDTIGIFRPSTSWWTLSPVNGISPDFIAFPFGYSGDIHLTGDWNGDGISTVGVVR